MTDHQTFDPSSVPPADDFDSDPAEEARLERLAQARALLDQLRPATAENVTAFLEADALQAAAIVRAHDLPYFVRLKEELRPHRVLREWLGGIGRAAADMGDGEQKVADKTRLVAIALDRLDLWGDRGDAGDGWCTLKEIGPACSWRIGSTEARRFLLRAYGERHKARLDDGREVPMAPGAQSLREAIDQLEAMACCGEARHPVFLRVGYQPDPETLVVDLCREDHAVVVVTAAGWEMVATSPVHFHRPGDAHPLPTPVAPAGTNPLGELREVLGFADPEHDLLWALVAGFLAACLRWGTSYPVGTIGGEHGTGKTTLIRILRRFVDPHQVDVQPRPKTEEDLFVNSAEQWLVAYDNLSTLTPAWSDSFCRISTGSAYSTRKFYTNRERCAFRVCRPQLITSIVDVVAAPDLLDRALLIAVPAIEHPKTGKQLMAEVEALAPRVLGQLLDAAVAALRGADDVVVEGDPPRMLDVVQWVEASAEVLGLEPGAFLAAYRDSRARAGELALESSLVGMHLRRMLDARDAWAAAAAAGKPLPVHAGPQGFRGTADELLAALNGYMTTHGERRERGWPQTPRGMSAALHRIAPTLRRAGYPVSFERQGRDRDSKTIITFETPSFSFQESPAAGSVRFADDRPHDPHRPPKNGLRSKDGDGGDGGDGSLPTGLNQDDDTRRVHRRECVDGGEPAERLCCAICHEPIAPGEQDGHERAHHECVQKAVEEMLS